MVTENQRRVLPLLFWAWGWVTGAPAWGTPPWTMGKRLTPSHPPPPPRSPEAQVSPAPLETSPLGSRLREAEVWSTAWLPESEPSRRLRRPGEEKECPECPLVFEMTLSFLWKVPAPPGPKGTGSACLLSEALLRPSSPPSPPPGRMKAGADRFPS